VRKPEFHIASRAVEYITKHLKKLLPRHVVFFSKFEKTYGWCTMPAKLIIKVTNEENNHIVQNRNNTLECRL
jgi:hypothetical protein